MTDEIVKFPQKGGSANQAAEEQSRSHLFASTIARLAAASTQEYERQRAQEAKNIQCRPAVLDRLVQRVRQEIREARSWSNFEDEVPITPGSMMNVAGDPVFEAVRLRFSKSHSGYSQRYEGPRLYSFCVAPDGEASIIVGWIEDAPR